MPMSMSYNDQLRDIINIEVTGLDKDEFAFMPTLVEMFGSGFVDDVKKIKEKVKAIPSKTGRDAAHMAETYQKTGIVALNAVCEGNLFRSIVTRGSVSGTSASYVVGTKDSGKQYYYLVNGRPAIDMTDGSHGDLHPMKFKLKCKGRWISTYHVDAAEPKNYMEYSKRHLDSEFVHMINEAIGNAFP